MKQRLILILLLCWSCSAWAQFTVSGTVTDIATGETLIGATVLDTRSGKGTVTNAYGFFSLTLKSDSVNLRISYVGYQVEMYNLLLTDNVKLESKLYPSTTLHEVVISAEKVQGVKSSQMSAIEVPVEHIKAVPVIFGEADVLKALQLLPGVQSGTEGMSGMYVRGGGPDENLFLLDGVSMYNVNHLGGFFSAFNSDAIKNVTLYKGSFPAHFGGRISSVLDVTTNNGNDKEYHGGLSVGVISAKLNLEGPIVKEKTTFSLSARRTYFDALIQPFVSLIGMTDGMKTNAGYYFYDLNAKVTHKFNESSRLYASYYMGDDVIYAKLKTREGIIFVGDFKQYMKLGYNWGNIVGSLRWNYVINPKLFMNVSGAYTRYRNDVRLGEEYSDINTYESAEMSYNSGIQDFVGRVDFDYTPDPSHNIKFGGTLTHHIFTPEVIGSKLQYIQNDYEYGEDYNYSLDTVAGQSKVNAEEFNVFIEDDWSITESIKLNGGVMMSGFAVQKHFYPSIQPRLSGRILLSDDLSVKAGYSYMTQYMHLLSNTSINLPTDLWVPVTARIAPMEAHQVAAGVFYNLKGLVDLSAEAYYKKMNNLMEYKDGASFWGSSVGWEDKVCMGEGWAYGLELLAQKTVGSFTGWVGYTWSKTERLFNRHGQELNNGQVFPAKYDRRHDLSIVVMYKHDETFDCSMNWVYSTGNAVTLALQEFEGIDDDLNTYYYNELGYIDHRNNYRMPAYHRMDISVNFHKKLKRGTRTWNVSVYNVYNRQNPFVVYKSYGTPSDYNGQHYGSSLMQLSLFPIIPSVSYIFKF